MTRGKSEAAKSIVSIGALYLDVVCHEFPFEDALWPEREVVGQDYDFLPGGSAVNFACTSSALGLPVTLIGKTGNDAPAHSLRELLGGLDIDLRTVEAPDVKTNISINFNGPAGNTLLTTVGSANQSMTGEEILPIATKAIESASYLYLGGCLKLTGLLPSLGELIAEAKRHDVKVVTDHGRVFGSLTDNNRRLVRELCAAADIYLPSVDELLDLWQAQSIPEAISNVREGCAATVVVKSGGNGVVGYSDLSEEQVAAYPVEVSNPVGAGDGFNAGFIRAHSEGLAFRDALDFGCATAALKISRREMPTYDEVLTLRYARTHS